MCKHTYSAEYTRGPRAMKGPCPYPELFQTLASGNGLGRERDIAPDLPIDDHGVCIFHSRDVEWKWENGFGERFIELLGLLDADEERNWYDFCEFVFVGTSADPDADPAQKPFRIADRTFSETVYFMGASFLAPLELQGVSFNGSASFTQATFEQDVRISATTFRGFDFIRGHAKRRFLCSNVEFLSYALFDHSRFTGETIEPVVKFSDSRFQGITDFSEVAFSNEGRSSVLFFRVAFEDAVDFTKTLFECHLQFDEVFFGDIVDFVDSAFEMVSSSARYRGAAVELNEVELGPNAVLTFKSNDPSKKMFEHDVQMRFKGEPAGIVRFENVNFSKLTPPSRERLMRLEKSGAVEIGPGCIKYRHQTEVRSIPVSQGNAPLVLELCQTFANYFTTSNGINLGFEVVGRTSTEVSFFYFTDEDISRDVFLERLRMTEVGLWNLLSVRSTGQLLPLESPPSSATPVRSERAAINSIDGLSALLGTFFRVGARIAFGEWHEADTKALLGALRFNENGAEERARHLHAVLVDNYTGRELVGINSRQNEPLPLLTAGSTEPVSVEKVRILFLGANSLSLPLNLELEVRKIETNLRLAQERDNLELLQEWAVTPDSLMQAMLDKSPTIVHFSGHGEESGIVLQDELGQARLVSAEALASLFELFRDRVQCVILSSCYSEAQAKAIRRHIPYVVGMSAAVPDEVAVAFSTGFYKAIGAGREIPFAYDFGKVAIRMEGIHGEAIPILL